MPVGKTAITCVKGRTRHFSPLDLEPRPILAVASADHPPVFRLRGRGPHSSSPPVYLQDT